MNLLIYIVAYPFIWFVSRLNFYLLYKLSDITYYFLYYVISYRKKTVRNNLKLAYPKIEFVKRKEIEKKYYRHLSDIFLESFKSMNIKHNELKKRYTFQNPELLRQIYNQNQDLILIAGHYASWEWVFALNNQTNYRVNAIYKKLSNKYFDRWAKKNRSQFGGNLIPTKETFREIHKHSQKKELNLYGFASDQSPKKSKASHWIKFLNNYVPVYIGAEVIAKKYNMAVVYLEIEKVGRGYYKTKFSLITDKPNKFKNYEITEKFMKKLEIQINKKPEFYTWTHKRFKHRKINSE